MQELNSEKIKYHGNLSADTVQKMKEFRAKIYDAQLYIEGLGGSAELTLAFRHLQYALMMFNCHVCYVDPQAVKEDILAETPYAGQEKNV